MSTNQFFNNFSYAGEQNLIEQLVIESIKQYGFDVKYLPRTIVNEDSLFGDDILSTFDAAATLEMYIRNVEGFEGEGDFLSRFNLEIRDTITFTVARKRFEQIRTEKLLTETGWNVLLEDDTEIVMEDGHGDNYTITSSRPLEGDLIYFDLTNKLYEIKFVEHEPVFYQTGALQMYDIRCELFEYSSERITTGDASIDQIETTHSLDLGNFTMLLEDGTALLNEDGDPLLLEWTYANTAPTADNEYITNQALNIIDFSESNPFSEQF